ncbi:MFS transporter [Microbacterium sp. Root53]|uniref:MFS transporter n=1 Tax=Microbacterium sp. Root53 TaxID=1736553 RepID=UPI0006FC37AC|nr:MFS transporter [Microbacterium sp. Root53]KQY96777.1 MFS transporter [Microbacterium sp. Root53]
MYISLRDRPKAEPVGRARRGRVSSTVVTLGVVSLLTDISSESVAAVLPLYLTSAMGLSLLAYGVVDGIFQGASAVVRIGGGWVSDRTDRPKWVAFCGYLLSAFSRGWLVAAQGFAAVAALVTIDRIGKGIRTAPRDAIIAASADPDDQARAFGVHRALDTVGAALGPLLAFVILAVVPGGYTVVFVLSLGSAVVGVTILGLLVPDRRPRRERAATGTRPAPFRWRHLAEPRLRRLLVVVGALSLLTIGDGFLYLSLQDRDDFAAHWFPLLYVGTNAVYIALAVPLGRLADRWGRTRVLVLGHLGLLGAYACALVPAQGAGPTLACLALLGAFYAATDGVLAAVAGSLVDPAARASAIGAAQTVVAVCRMVAATAFGALWFALGRTESLLVVAILMALAVPCYLIALSRRARRSRPAEAAP